MSHHLDPTPGASTDGRPDSAAAVLDAAARWLDLGDQAMELVVRIQTAQAGATADPDDATRAVETVQGKSVQADLRMLATWLREHPDVDAQMHTVLTAYPAR